MESQKNSANFQKSICNKSVSEGIADLSSLTVRAVEGPKAKIAVLWHVDP